MKGGDFFGANIQKGRFAEADLSFANLSVKSKLTEAETQELWETVKKAWFADGPALCPQLPQEGSSEEAPLLADVCANSQDEYIKKVVDLLTSKPLACGNPAIATNIAGRLLNRSPGYSLPGLAAALAARLQSCYEGDSKVPPQLWLSLQGLAKDVERRPILMFHEISTPLCVAGEIHSNSDKYPASADLQAAFREHLRHLILKNTNLEPAVVTGEEGTVASILGQQDFWSALGARHDACAVGLAVLLDYEIIDQVGLIAERYTTPSTKGTFTRYTERRATGIEYSVNGRLFTGGLIAKMEPPQRFVSVFLEGEKVDWRQYVLARDGFLEDDLRSLLMRGNLGLHEFRGPQAGVLRITLPSR